MIGFARSALEHVRTACEYLLFSQTVRLVLVLAAVIGGVPLLRPLPLLTWGLILDFGAVLSFVFRRPQMEILTVPLTRLTLPHRAADFLFPVSVGAAAGVLLSALPFLASRFGYHCDDFSLSLVLWIGGIFASFAAALAYMRHASLFAGDFRITRALLAYAVLTAAAIAWGIWRIPSGNGRVWPVLLIAAVPALIVAVLCEIQKKMEKRPKDG